MREHVTNAFEFQSTGILLGGSGEHRIRVLGALPVLAVPATFMKEDLVPGAEVFEDYYDGSVRGPQDDPEARPFHPAVPAVHHTNAGELEFLQRDWSGIDLANLAIPVLPETPFQGPPPAPDPPTSFPDDPQYRKDHKLELEYIDPTAGPETFANLVLKPTHGAAAFRALLGEIQAGDEVYIVTWAMSPDLELVRDGWDKPVADPARQDVRLGKALLVAARRGARISIIVWDIVNIPLPSSITTLDTADGIPPIELEEVRNNSTDPRTRIKNFRDELRKVSALNEILMLGHPKDPLGSHHQKFWLVRKGKRLHGFVGGINMNFWDWDEPAHDPLEPRRNPPEMEGADRKARFDRGDLPAKQPRHDWMLEVTGSAAYALLEEFHRRWAAQSTQTAPPKPKVTDIESIGKMFVQISRQWPGSNKPGDTPANEILKAYRKAFERAQKYIYIENQYWTNSELTDLLLRRLEDEFAPMIVIVLPAKAEDKTAPLFMPEQRFQLGRLRARAGPGRLLVYQLFRKVPNKAEYVDVYVHAKLAIVDDRWMTVGSANTNNRSLGLDSEENAQLAHTDFVTGVRKEIWRELTGSADATDSDPLQAILKGFHVTGVRNDQAKKAGEELSGFVVPLPDDEPGLTPRLPEKLRKYI